MIELNITPEDIDRIVKDSVMKAGFGKAIETGLQNALRGYNNPVETELKKYVAELASQLMRERYAEQIKAAVAAAIAERITDEMINTTVSAAITRMERAAEDRY